MSDSLYYYKYLKYKTLCDNLLGGTPTFNVDKFKKYCEGLSVEDINTKLKEIINNNFIIKTQVSSYIIDNREPSNLKKLASLTICPTDCTTQNFTSCSSALSKTSLTEFPYIIGPKYLNLVKNPVISARFSCIVIFLDAKAGSSNIATT